MHPANYTDLMQRARAGDPAATDHLLSCCRTRLKELAATECREQLGPDWDPSDLVQESLIEVHRDFADFRGQEVGQLYSWLRTIMQNNLTDRVRYQTRQRRCASSCQTPEMPKGATVKRSLPASDDGSSVCTRLIRVEELRQLFDAITSLPRHQAEVIRLRHLEGLSLDEIAASTRRTRPSVAGLLIRAVRQLREACRDE